MILSSPPRSTNRLQLQLGEYLFPSTAVVSDADASLHRECLGAHVTARVGLSKKRRKPGLC